MSNTLDDLTISCVISGIPGYFKLRSKHDHLFKMTGEELQSTLKYIESKLKGKVILTGLYNAYTEETMARRATESPGINLPFTEIFPSGIYADSGGLQMVTLGKGTIEKEDRMKIYETQAKFSDCALSFDEIPAQFVDDKRYYLPDLVESKAEESGYNLKEQMDYFDSVDTKCKVVPIVQGWGVADTDKFAKGLFKDLTTKQKKDLNVFATGFPNNSVHGGAMRIFDLYQCKHIPKNAKKHFHALGVTGFKRLIPMLQVIKHGFAPEIKQLSFDSVSLTMTYVMGNVVPHVNDFKENKPKRRLGKTLNVNVREYWQEMFDFYKDAPNFDYEDVDDLLQHSYYNKTIDKNGKSLNLSSGFQQYEYYLQADEDGNATEENQALADSHFKKVLKQEQYFILYNIYKYVMILEEFIEGKVTLAQIFNPKDLKFYEALENVNTVEEFKDWREFLMKDSGFKLESISGDRVVSAEETTSLFFEAKEPEKKERKKAPPRIAKETKIVNEDDTSTMDSLF